MTEQLDLTQWLETHRQGQTYSPVFDEARLNRQAQLVYNAMKHGGWWTLRELAEETGQPEASISARIRDLANLHGLKKERRRRGEESRGLHEYRIVGAQ